MKVLHILYELQFSGAELMLHTAAERFDVSGLETTILATGPAEGIYAGQFKKLGWRIVHIPFRKRISFFKELYTFFKTSSFDVIHIHTDGALIYKTFIARLAGVKKVISTVHNNFQFKGYLKYRRQLHHLMAVKLFNVKFIAISESVKQTEKQVYYTDTTLINNWIDIKKFSNADQLPPKKAVDIVPPATIRLISIGRCVEEKQHKKIFELLKELCSRKISCHYTHIGCGNLEGEEIQWAAKHNLLPYVTFVQHTSDVSHYLSTANYYLMPSTFEGIGNACLEAMAAGVLCVVNNAPGLNTLIENNATGIIMDFDDIKPVADALMAVHNSAGKYQVITRNAKRYVGRNHSMNNVSQMIALYQ